MNLSAFNPDTASDADLLAAQRALATAGFYRGALDGWFGRMSRAALAAWRAAQAAPASPTLHHVHASSFADPADVAAFRRAKARGLTDQQAFKLGDNGIGYWGDDTTAPRPMCALPHEVWKPLGASARGRKVRVQANAREIICELRDTMPEEENITNGAGVDLNPTACAALALKPPVMVPAVWSWA